LKTYNQYNFFKYTFCEFHQVDDFTFREKENYKSKSESSYFYTEDGVYRKSDHWGRVANCRWKINVNKNYKNQQIVVGFAKWTNFHPINSLEKNFYIEVDFQEKKTKIQPKKESDTNYLFTFSEAHKRAKQITHLFKEYKWTTHFDSEIDELRFNIFSKYINSDKTLQEIKNEQK
tara:strand:+ start:6382 stop:6906 length:525 start_codon:yes stop_codon:yes gene_type:complete